MTYSYQFGPVVLESDCELPELTPASPSKPPVLAIHTVDDVQYERVEWYHEWRFDTGELWLSLGHVREDYVLRFGDMADFTIVDGGLSISMATGPKTLPSTLRHLLLDQVVPLALSHRGTLVLHGAAVAGGEGAVAFIGGAGHGKSTLTTALTTAGARALADDTLFVTEDAGVVLAHPAYPSVRLWPDTAAALLGSAPSHGRRVSQYNDKVRVGASWLAFGTSAVPLRRIYLLSPDAAAARPRIEPVEGQGRLIELLRHAFVLDGEDEHVARMRFEAVARIAARVPVRRLTFRQAFEDLPRLRQALVEDLLQPQLV